VKVIGIVTLENVIERVLLLEINDEKDREGKQRGISYLTKNDFLS
jgi:CBS domain containing-hemolysin-like protein